MKKQYKPRFIIPEKAKRKIMNTSKFKKRKEREKMFFILDAVCRYHNRSFDKNHLDFIPLKSTILKSFLGNSLYVGFIDELINLGIMERSKSYQSGVRSKGFRIRKYYHDSPLTIIDVQDRILQRKIRDTREKRLKCLGNLELQLYQNLRLINIDLNSAIKYIENCLEKREDYGVSKYNSDLLSIMEIENRNFRFVRDEFGNRIHHNLTNLRSELKQFLRINTGEGLVGLDISNSQPFLFNIIIKKRFNQKMPKDAKLFLDLTSKGKLYEYLAEGMICKKGRKQLKREFFGKVFFSRNIVNNKANENEYTRLMDDTFPSVMSLIRRCKMKNHKDLPKALQRIESYLIIDSVLKSIMEKFPKIFVLNIHDEIITTKSNLHSIRSTAEIVFQKLGLSPSFKISNY